MITRESVAKVPGKTATMKRGPSPPRKTLAELPGRRSGTGGQAACFQQWRDARRRVRGTFAISSRYFYIASAILIFAVVSAGFAGTLRNRPSRAELDETVKQGILCGNAVGERGLAGSLAGGLPVNGGQAFLPYCGPRQPYFASLQQALEGLAPGYVDHVNGPFNDPGDAVLRFTLETWRSAAGLSASGFRRYDAGGKMSYGIVREDDLIRAPLFEDLRKGFLALKWTASGIAWESINSGGGHGRGNGMQPDDVDGWRMAVQRADWEWPKGQPYSSQPHAFTFGDRDLALHPQFCADVCRSKSVPKCSAAAIKHTISFYVRGLFARGAKSIYDDSGDGINEGQFYLKESAAVSESSGWIGKVIGQNNTNKPVWCAAPDRKWPLLSQSRGYICDGICIIKYIFTDSK